MKRRRRASGKAKPAEGAVLTAQERALRVLAARREDVKAAVLSDGVLRGLVAQDNDWSHAPCIDGGLVVIWRSKDGESIRLSNTGERAIWEGKPEGAADDGWLDRLAVIPCGVFGGKPMSVLAAAVGAAKDAKAAAKEAEADVASVNAAVGSA